MPKLPPSPAGSVRPRVPLWNRPAVRAGVYQALVLGACIGLGATIFHNTLVNLRQRGIASGFGFLVNEAGFDISETLPFPLLEGGFLWLLGAVALGGAATWLLARGLARRGQHIGGDWRWIALVLLWLVALPAAVVYVGSSTFSLGAYGQSSSYTIALLVGLLNTLKVSLVGIVLATVWGLLLGVARLSSNWLVNKLAMLYVETIRNVPLLVQIFFWYKGVLQALPDVRESLHLGGGLILNNRGVYLPRPDPAPGLWPMLLALLAALTFTLFWARWSRIRQARTGADLPVLLPALAVGAGLCALAWLLAGAPCSLSFPELSGFNFQGGLVLSPEYTALLTALVIYTSAYIAEIVRSGILSVSRGQREAALALGLRDGLVMRLVILPQALRVIVPPLTSEYLNLTKNSSLGVAVAYPELVSVGGTILNQSGQAIEIIGLTMAVYLTISLLISLGMNWYNARVRLVER